jgi:hypothetical protein
MRKRTNLVLARQTLRVLHAPQLRRAAGGGPRGNGASADTSGTASLNAAGGCEDTSRGISNDTYTCGQVTDGCAFG